tara:strand:+ start:122 stop:373 length:252 start_codon:yes stop_codon:yes gene_type:complete
MNLFKHLILVLYFLIFGNIVNAENIKSKVENKIYSKIDDFAQNIGEDFADSLSDFENLKYLDFSFNVQEGFDPSIQIESVSNN